MRLHRFFGNFNLSERDKGNLVEISDKEIVNQITRVFRLRGGDFITLLDGKQNEALGQIVEIDPPSSASYRTTAGCIKNNLKIKIIKTYKNKNESNIKVSLYCAILKKENFETIVQKATEVGVSEIIPIKTERIIKVNLSLDRLFKIAKEATEQSYRGIIPIISPIMEFKNALNNASANDCKIIFDLSGGNFSKINCEKAKTVAIFIGPEGGFSENEIVLAKKGGFEVLSLGKLTLRAETAAIVASYLITYNKYKK